MPRDDDADPAKAGKKQAGRFKPGQSGNPAGRKQGRRARSTILAEQMMRDDAGAVVRAVIDAANRDTEHAGMGATMAVAQQRTK